MPSHPHNNFHILTYRIGVIATNFNSYFFIEQSESPLKSPTARSTCSKPFFLRERLLYILISVLSQSIFRQVYIKQFSVFNNAGIGYSYHSSCGNHCFFGDFPKRFYHFLKGIFKQKGNQHLYKQHIGYY